MNSSLEIGDPTHRKYDYKEIGMALLAITVLGLAAALAFILLTQQSNASNLKDIKQSNDILIDCTTPKHACYERGQATTGKAIKQLNDFQKQTIIIAAHCTAIGNYSVSAISNCVNRTLKQIGQ
jgi:hypothetical protein